MHLTSLMIFLTLASQKAPLYLALTSVPTVRNGGSSLACNATNHTINYTFQSSVMLRSSQLVIYYYSESMSCIFML